MQLNGDVLAAFLSSFGGVETYTLITSVNGTAYDDYVFNMILDRVGFHSIPHIITYRDTTMTVIVEARIPLCWDVSCWGTLDALARKKKTKNKNSHRNDNKNSHHRYNQRYNHYYKEDNSSRNHNRKNKNKNPNPKTGNHPNKEEGWTQVTHKGKNKNLPLIQQYHKKHQKKKRQQKLTNQKK